jgi:zinc transporter ZupT
VVKALVVLFVLIAFRSVPIDGELLTVFAIGIAVSVAVFLAWVNRARPLAVQGLGAVAALAGALIGTTLGLKAIDLPFVNVTTGIVGAAAGANLLLLGLDIVWDQKRHDHRVPAPETPTAPAPETAPAQKM